MKTIINSKQANEMLNNVLNDQGIKCYTFDLYANYSTEQSQFDFVDFKNEIENHSLWLGDRKTDYLVIFESEALKDAPYYKKSVLSKMRKADLFGLCKMFGLIGFWKSEEDYLKSDLIYQLLHVNNELFYSHHYSENTWRDLEYTFKVTGYSQGDVVKVLLVGDVEPYINEEYLQNIFYDSPISGHVTVSCNDEYLTEIHFSEVDYFNEYDHWDKSDFIEKVKNTKWINGKEYFNLLIEYLENALPSSLKYDY